MGLSTLQVATIFSTRQLGSGVVHLVGGVLVDAWKKHWGMMLVGCMIASAIFHALFGLAPTFIFLAILGVSMAVPGAIWHLPSTAAISQIFPDKRGFAIATHGTAASIGGSLGPVLAGALLTGILWRNIFYLYALASLLVAIFVWWSLRHLQGKDDPQGGIISLRRQINLSLSLMKNPVVIALVIAGMLRGMGLNGVLQWTPFYLENELGMGHFEAGLHYGLLTAMGIISAPILGSVSDKIGRKLILVPGLLTTAILCVLLVIVGSSNLIILVMAGLGIFTIVMHQLIQAAALDSVNVGQEATVVGMIFGLMGLAGIGSPFLVAIIVDQFGGYGAAFYYVSAISATAAIIIMFIPLDSPNKLVGKT